MKISIIFIAFTVLATAVAEEILEVPSEDAVAAAALRDGANSFAFNLMKKLAVGKEENTVVSPWSLTSALLLLREGAEGKTTQELQSSLGLPEDIEDTRKGYTKIVGDLQKKDSKNSLDIANAMFPHTAFTPRKEFSKILQTIYSSMVKTVDFQMPEEAASTINDWAEENTGGLVKNVLNPDMITPDTVLVLANAVHFKGVWKQAFNESDTTEEKFYPRGYKEESITVPMMKKEDEFLYGDISDLDSQALVLPYDNEKFYMLILLPNQNTNVDEVISKITSVDDILKQMSTTEVILSLPRFKIESSHTLKETLKQLGIEDVFSGGADLSGISASPLSVSDVVQKAVIEVNEEGTEAASATVGIIMPLIGDMPGAAFFTVHRPFVSLIVDKESGIVLFSSKVVSP